MAASIERMFGTQEAPHEHDLPDRSDPPERRETFAERGARREDLEARITTLQAEINAAQAQLAKLIAEHTEEEFWADHSGVMTPSYFLSWKLGHTPSSARHLLGIATKLEDHPQITAAFSAGELSLAQTNILMDISEPETEEELLELAHGLSGGQLSRFAGLYRSALRAEQDTSHRDRYLRTTHRDDGSWRITGSLSSENGAIFDRALRAATQKMTADGYTRDEHATDPWAAEDADALLYLGEHLLSGGQGIRPNHERFQVVVHLDADKLDQGAVCRLQDGGIISSDSARRLLCDSSVLEMIHKGDEVLHLGRTSRRPNRAMRRVLEAKQHCCAFPGCARKGVSAHHIEWWARDNGTTDIDNLVLLCHSHHRAIHDGDITIEDSEAGLTFRDRGGTVIERPHLRATSELASINRARGICVTEETCLPGWGGEQGDLTYVADVYASSRWSALRRRDEASTEASTEPGDHPGPSP